MDNSPVGAQPDHLIRLEELFARLRSGDAGLDPEEADRRLASHGLNELKVRKNVPEIVKFLREFTNFFAILLMVGGCLALLADYLDPG